MQFAEESEYLEHLRADEVRAAREVLYLESGGGLVGSEVVVEFGVGELVDGTGVKVGDIFQRYVDEVFGNVGVDVDGRGFHVLLRGLDGDQLMESEVEDVLFVRIFDETDEMDDIGDRWWSFKRRSFNGCCVFDEWSPSALRGQPMFEECL